MNGYAVIGGLTWAIREGTTDWNTINACCGEDEYSLRDVDVEDKLVFDLGAHVGGVGVWLASRGARVVFVEPVPSNVEQIRKNLGANKIPARHVLRAALGTNRVNLGPKGDAHEFIANIGDVDGERPLECTEVTFSALVNSYGAPDIVKLDCEGGEWSVFHDEAIRKVPLIVGEYHPDRPGGADYTSADIIASLPGHDVVVGPNPVFDAFRATLRSNF